MLSDPKRLRTPGGHGYLVSWKHRLRVQGDDRAAATVERILDDPANVEALRAGLGRPEATLDELAEWLITGLSSGALQLLKTRVHSPVMDRPPETDLFDLLPPAEPREELESLSFEVVDGGGQGVAVQYQLHAPSGDPMGSLPAGERRSVAELDRDANVEVELSGVLLPLHEENEEEEQEQEEDHNARDSDFPNPLGPEGTEPRPPGSPHSLGPDGVEPSLQRIALHRAEPTPFVLHGALGLPGHTAQHEHFVAVVLAAVLASRNFGNPAIWLVVVGPQPLASARCDALEAVVRGTRDAWVDIATQSGALEELLAYFAHLRSHRGWSHPSQASPEADVECFQADYNTRFETTILRDGVCGTQTLGAVFDVLTDELRRWADARDVDLAELQGSLLRFVAAEPSQTAGERQPETDGLDTWVFDEAELPSPPELPLLYADARADISAFPVPWSFETDELVVRLRTEDVSEFDAYVSVRLERSDGTWTKDLPLSPSQTAQDITFTSVSTSAAYSVSLVRHDGTREVVIGNQPFSAFLDDRELRQ